MKGFNGARLAVLFPTALTLIACQADTESRTAASSAPCAREPGDSARTVDIAVAAASRQAGRPQRVHEFRREPGGFSILTLPERVPGRDGDLTVRLNCFNVVVGFGPDSV
jgi:hypothetical protein